MTIKGGSFRIRRVADWLGATATEDISKTGGLAGGQGKVMTKTELAYLLSELEFVLTFLAENLRTLRNCSRVPQRLLVAKGL
jgi:hypothetical protein